MQVIKRLAGKAKLGIEEYVEPVYNREVDLEYYLLEVDGQNQLHEQQKVYGIQVVKTEVDKANNINTETELVSNISSNREGVKEIIQKLIKFKVTPIALQNVIDDMISVAN